MKLERLHISGFGRLLDLDLEFGPGLTVVAGPNEAGKSTIVECLVRLLFGFPETQYHKPRKRYEPWQPGVPYGARLRYRLDDGRAFEVARDFVRPDVPTLVVEADTRRPVTVGNKSTSPGEDALAISLAVYRSAAVMTAGDLVADKNDSADALADRLAAVIGSAGQQKAADAIERLKKAYGEIGLSGQNTPLGKASRDAEEAERALVRFHDDYRGFEETVRRQTELTERVHELTARRSRCAAAIAARDLRSIRARITAATQAQEQLDHALAQRSSVQSGTADIAGDRDTLDAAIEALRSAEQTASEAAARAAAKMADRSALQREVDAAGNALLDKRAAVARLDESIATHEAAAKGRPPIDVETLAALEREADAVDAAESKARTLETNAAIARQRPHTNGGVAGVCGLIVIVLAIAWFASHAVLFGAAAGLFAIATVASVVRFVSGERERRRAIDNAERAAAEASDATARATAALDAKCRQLGCSNVAAVRAARTAQVDLDRLRAERKAAAEAASLLAAQRQTLDQRLADFDALDRDRRQAADAAQQSREALDALFDRSGVPAGELDDRIGWYRRLRDAGEATARADAAVGNARAVLERALGGSTLAELETDALRCAEEAAGGGEPDEFAAYDDAALREELQAVERSRREAERSLEGARARVAEFDRQHPVAAAELEERASSAAERRDHLRRVRQAAEDAWKTIESVKDAVHRDFTPVLNEAVGRSMSTITGGRYETAWIDQADFRIRLRVPETDTTQEGSVLSTGTVEQLQFALRAALAGALGSGERVPLLYDDALAYADDDRARAALARAAELATLGEQIVLFTQRGNVESIAGAISAVKVLRIPGPAA